MISTPKLSASVLNQKGLRNDKRTVVTTPAKRQWKRRPVALVTKRESRADSIDVTGRYRMNRSRFLTVATLVSLISCGDEPGAVVTNPIQGGPPTIPGSTAAIAGTIEVSGSGPDLIVELRDVDGDVVR